MTKKRVVLAGECMVEFASQGEDSYRLGYAGDVYNTAVYLSRSCAQECDVQFMTVVGKDAVSAKLLALMESEKIGCEFLWKDASATLGAYCIQLDPQGERQFIYWRGQSAARRLLQHIGDPTVLAANPIDMLYFSGITLAILTPEDRAQFFALAALWRNAGARIVFDPNYRPRLWPDADTARAAFQQAYELSEIALPGIDDHRMLYNQDSAREVIDFLQGCGVAEVVVKDGPNGATLAVDGDIIQVPAVAVSQVVDTTAAGDSFNGAYLSARLRGLDARTAAEQAAKLASDVVQHRGAIVAM